MSRQQRLILFRFKMLAIHRMWGYSVEKDNFENILVMGVI